MNKQNKLLDQDIKERFAEERKYQPKEPKKKKKRTILEIVLGIAMFVILLSNIIMMLFRMFIH